MLRMQVCFSNVHALAVNICRCQSACSRYWEPQQGLNCLVHAYNMMCDYQCVSATELREHVSAQMMQDVTYLSLAHLSPGDLFAATGDFSLHCINHLCIHTQQRSFVGKRIELLTPLAAVKAALHSHNHRALLLTSPGDGCNGHFRAIKQHACGTHHVYDSLQADVTALDTAFLNRLHQPVPPTF